LPWRIISGVYKTKKHIGVKKEYKLSYSNIIDFYRIKNLGGLCKQTKAE